LLVPATASPKSNQDVLGEASFYIPIFWGRGVVQEGKGGRNERVAFRESRKRGGVGEWKWREKSWSIEGRAKKIESKTYRMAKLLYE